MKITVKNNEDVINDFKNHNDILKEFKSKVLQNLKDYKIETTVFANDDEGGLVLFDLVSYKFSYEIVYIYSTIAK